MQRYCEQNPDPPFLDIIELHSLALEKVGKAEQGLNVFAEYIRRKEETFGPTSKYVAHCIDKFLARLNDYPDSPLVPEFLRKKIRAEVLSKQSDITKISSLYQSLGVYYMHAEDIPRAALCYKRSEIQ